MPQGRKPENVRKDMSDTFGCDELTLVQQPPNINAEMPIGARAFIIDKDSEYIEFFAGRCD